MRRRERTVATPSLPEGDGLNRLLDLTIALLCSPQPRSPQWIFANVAAYKHRAAKVKADSLERSFQRDRDILDAVGLHLRRKTNGWTLVAEDVLMPSVPADARTLEALARGLKWAESSEMSVAATTAIRKLRAAGHDIPDLDSPQLVGVPIADRTKLDNESFRNLFKALECGLTIEFSYYPALETYSTRRTFEPWALGAVAGTLYLSGFDRQRQAQRTFRLARIDSIDLLAEPQSHPRPEATPEEIVVNGLRDGGFIIDAQVAFHQPDGAWELREKADAEGRCVDVEKQWLIATATRLASEVTVLSPDKVRERVNENLATAKEVYEELVRTVEPVAAEEAATAAAAAAGAQLEDDGASVEVEDQPQPSPRRKRATLEETLLEALLVLAWFSNRPGSSIASAQMGLDLPASRIRAILAQVQYSGEPGLYPGSLIEVDANPRMANVIDALGLDRPTRLSSDEVGVLNLGLEAYRSTLPAADRDAVTAAMAFVRQVGVGGAQHESVAADVLAPKVGDCLSAIVGAIRDRCLIEVTYHSASSGTVRRRVLNPDDTRFIDGKAYLWAREWPAAASGEIKQRTYALSRMSEIEIREPGSAPDAPQKPELSIDDPFNFTAAEQWLTVDISPQSTWMLEYYPLHVLEEQPEEQPEGGLRAILPYTGEWTVSFLVAFAANLHVVYDDGHPDSLGPDAVLEIARGVVARANTGLAAYAGDQSA